MVLQLATRPSTQVGGEHYYQLVGTRVWRPVAKCLDRTNRVKYWPKWWFGTKTNRLVNTSSDWPGATAWPLASKLECIHTGPSAHLPLERWTQWQSTW